MMMESWYFKPKLLQSSKPIKHIHESQGLPRCSLIQALQVPAHFISASLLNSMPGESTRHFLLGLERLAKIIPSHAHQGMVQPHYNVAFLAENEEKQSPNVYTA